MSEKMNELMEKSPDKVKGVLNILMESPYFYRFDDEELFLFLRRNEPEFREFNREWSVWELNMDDKCARVLKSEWFNKAITPANRLQFRLGKRDECIAFMLLIEFFEKTLEENSMTADEARNPMFKFGDLLEFQRQRFQELFKDDVETYTSEYVQRNILLPLMPQLVKHRFLNEEPRPKGMPMRGVVNGLGGGLAHSGSGSDHAVVAGHGDHLDDGAHAAAFIAHHPGKGSPQLGLAGGIRYVAHFTF